MTIRQLALHLEVEPGEVAAALEAVYAPHLVSYDSEIPIGGYELAVARHIIKKQKDLIYHYL